MITKYVAIAVAIIITLLTFGLYILKKENNKLHEAEGTYKAQLVELSSAIKEKDIILDAVGKRINEMKVESDKRSVAAEEARITARQAGKVNRELADKLLTLQRKPNQSLCDATNDLFDYYIEHKQP